MDRQAQRALLKEIKKRPEKFGQVYDLYFDRILNYVLKRTFHFETARDITSEVFLKAFLAIQRFSWKDIDLLIWIYKIAQNEIRLYFRSKNYRPEYLYESLEAFTSFASPSVEEEKIKIEQQFQQLQAEKKIVDLLHTLPDLQRECISLKYLDSFTYE